MEQLPNDLIKKTESCWLWIGSKLKGYGRWHNRQAHVVAYEMEYGPVPNGLQLDHLCRVKSCVNTAHLEPVTSRENTLRGFGPTAMHARQTHCKMGHLLSVENCLPFALTNGKRQCRLCQQKRNRAWIERVRLRL